MNKIMLQTPSKDFCRYFADNRTSKLLYTIILVFLVFNQ